MGRPGHFSRWWLWCLGVGAALIALGGKLVLVERYGTDQPYFDQWAAEGMYFLRGPLYYSITPEQLISHHGEHRPALMRLWVRALIVANEGQWDCFLELVANLLIYGAFLLILWGWLLTILPVRWLLLPAILLAGLFALPCAYENFLWGFQSVFLFLLLFGTIHIAGALREMRLDWKWWVGHGAGCLALFSVAAGAMSAAALLGLALVELMRGRRGAWVWCTLGANAVLLAVGIALLPPDAGGSGGLWPRLVQALCGTGALLSWPFQGTWASLALHLPWLLLLGAAWWRPNQPDSVAGRALGAMGTWVAGIAFAIAFGRVVTPETIGVRYYDVLILGLFIAGAAWAALYLRCNRRVSRLACSVAAVVWLAVLGWRVAGQNRPEALHNFFAYQLDAANEQRDHVRNFLANGDVSTFRGYADTSHRFPHYDITLDFLRDPKIRPLLPPSLTPDGHQSRLSKLARVVADRCWWMVGFGAVLFLAGAIRLSQREQGPRSG